MSRITLTRYLVEKQRERGLISAELRLLLEVCARACKSIATAVGKGALAGVLGDAGSSNIQGEAQKKLDVIANETLLEANEWGGHLAAMLLDQGLRQRDHVLGLSVEQPDRLDVLLQPFFAERDHLFGRIDLGEERAGGAVDARIRGLRRQDDGDEQCVDVDRFEFGLGRGIRLGQPAEELENVRLLQRPNSLQTQHLIHPIAARRAAREP